MKVKELSQALVKASKKIEFLSHKLRIQKIAHEEQKRNLRIQYKQEIAEEAEQKMTALQKLFITQSEYLEDQYHEQRHEVLKKDAAVSKLVRLIIYQEKAVEEIRREIETMIAQEPNILAKSLRELRQKVTEMNKNKDINIFSM